MEGGHQKISRTIWDMKTAQERRLKKVEEPFIFSGLVTVANDDYNDERNRMMMMMMMRITMRRRRREWSTKRKIGKG